MSNGSSMEIKSFFAHILVVAFLIALNQNKQLIGSRGLLPANLYLHRLRSHYNTSSYLSLLNTAPTLFWWASAPDQLDLVLDLTAYTGLALSMILVVIGAGNMVIFTILWILYQSLCNIGQQWYCWIYMYSLMLCVSLSVTRYSFGKWVYEWVWHWFLTMEVVCN